MPMSLLYTSEIMVASPVRRKIKNIYMKKTLLILLIGSLLFSCAPAYHPSHGHRLPPGQAKKVYGTKSAKPFAPGQQKKHRR